MANTQSTSALTFGPIKAAVRSSAIVSRKKFSLARQGYSPVSYISNDKSFPLLCMPSVCARWLSTRINMGSWYFNCFCKYLFSRHPPDVSLREIIYYKRVIACESDCKKISTELSQVYFSTDFRHCSLERERHRSEALAISSSKKPFHIL